MGPRSQSIKTWGTYTTPLTSRLRTQRANQGREKQYKRNQKLLGLGRKASLSITIERKKDTTKTWTGPTVVEKRHTNQQVEYIPTVQMHIVSISLIQGVTRRLYLSMVNCPTHQCLQSTCEAPLEHRPLAERHHVVTEATVDSFASAQLNHPVKLV